MHSVVTKDLSKYSVDSGVVGHSSSPETDIPDASVTSTGVFDYAECLRSLVASSDGWSFRDLDKVLNGIVSSILGTEACKLTSQIFMQQTRNIVKDKTDTLPPTP